LSRKKCAAECSRLCAAMIGKIKKLQEGEETAIQKDMILDWRNVPDSDVCAAFDELCKLAKRHRIDVHPSRDPDKRVMRNRPFKAMGSRPHTPGNQPAA
jgi:hypothetical protein